MRLKRVFLEHDTLERYGSGVSYSVVNFDKKTLITQQDLKKRTESVAFSKYKEIKRDVAQKEALRRLNWFMSIVRAKSIATKWLSRDKGRLEE